MAIANEKTRKKSKMEAETMNGLAMERRTLERYITKLMIDLGVPAHLKGYHYLREAVMVSENDLEAVTSVTKILYPSVARTFRTSGQKVERAIRNAIEVSWERGNEKTMKDIFGYSSISGKQRPTNSEYIARMADKVRLDMASV